MINLNDIQRNIDIAKNWLLNSGIQNKDGRLKGSFNAWYDVQKKRHSFAYSEITGYAVTTLLFLNIFKRDEKLLESANLAAKWLMDEAFDNANSAILCRFEHDLGEFAKRMCTFDNGMCLNGITNMYKITQDSRYLEFANKISKWMLKMQKSDGSFYTRLILPDFLEGSGDKWSKQSGAFHGKLAIGLINLGKLTGDKELVESARKILDYILQFQTKDGRFITDSLTKATFLHPCCYACEGLLVAGTQLKEKKYIDSVKKCMRWIATNRMANFGFPAHFENEIFAQRESPDISAQVLRLMIALNVLRFDEYSDEFIDQTVKNILKYQMNDKDPKVSGGFVSGDAWFHNEKSGPSGFHVNSWVTMFSLQAICMQKYKDINEESLFYLV